MQTIGQLLTIFAVVFGGINTADSASLTYPSEEAALADMLDCWHAALPPTMAYHVWLELWRCSHMPASDDGCLTIGFMNFLQGTAVFAGPLCFGGCVGQNLLLWEVDTDHFTYNDQVTRYLKLDYLSAYLGWWVYSAFLQCPDRQWDCVADDMNASMKSNVTDEVESKIGQLCFRPNGYRAVQKETAAKNLASLRSAAASPAMLQETTPSNPPQKPYAPSENILQERADCFNRTLTLGLGYVWRDDVNECASRYTDIIDIASCLRAGSYEGGILGTASRTCVDRNYNVVQKCMVKDLVEPSAEDILKTLKDCQTATSDLGTCFADTYINKNHKLFTESAIKCSD